MRLTAISVYSLNNSSLISYSFFAHQVLASRTYATLFATNWCDQWGLIVSNFWDYKVQFTWSYICMNESYDFLAGIIHIFPFLLFFFLVCLIILRDCISIGFLLHPVLNSQRRRKIPHGDTLECWTIQGDERRTLYSALFFHHSSDNPLPNTSLPLGRYWTTQNCLQ